MSTFSVRIGAGSLDEVSEDRQWCATLMARSQRWITLGRDRAACMAALGRPGSELFIAIGPTEERVGFIVVAPYGLAGSPYIAAIAVVETARGQGVGSELLRFVEARFAERRHLFLLVSSFNTGAQQLYRRHGFQRVGALPGYVAADHLGASLS